MHRRIGVEVIAPGSLNNPDTLDDIDNLDNLDNLDELDNLDNLDNGMTLAFTAHLNFVTLLMKI